MRALIAVRLSVDTDATTSPERQLEACEAYCKARGWDVVGVARDLDVSATKTRPWERPELGPWLRGERDEFDVIVVWRFDRIARRVLDLLKLMEPAPEGYGYGIASTSEAIDSTTAYGEFMVTLLAAVARMEARNIADRVSSARAHMRRVGRWAGGHVPFGYQAVPRDGGGLTLIPDPELVEVIRNAAARALGGESWYSLAEWLTETGVPTPRDADAARRGKDTKRPVWHPETVSQVMQSPVLLGYAMHGGRPVAGPDGRTLPPAFPAILDDDTHRALRAEARKRRGTRRERRKAAAPLLGIAMCAACGDAHETDVRLYGDIVDSKPRYKCTKYANRETGGCGMTVSARALEPWVERELLARVGAGQLMDEITTPGRDVAAELEDLDARMADMRADRAAGLYRSAADAAWFRGTYAQMQDERDRLAAMPASDGPTVTYVPTGRTLRDEWTTADAERRRQLMLDMGVRVYVSRSPQRGKLTVAQMEGRFRMVITNPDAVALEDALDAVAVDVDPETEAAEARAARLDVFADEHEADYARDSLTDDEMAEAMEMAEETNDAV